MPVDIKVLVMKIFGYFHIYMIRVDFAGQEYKKILGYVNASWLSLLPALKNKILKIHPSLKFFFISETQLPKILKLFLENSETELLLSFAYLQASLFLKVVEGDDKYATESALAVKLILLILQTPRAEHFIPHM
jgi:hypothetical protein